VKVYFKINENSLSIVFEDNGIGIPKKYFNKIWEMFSRLRAISKYEGTGLGLATCKKIIDDLKGTVHLSSVVGVGSVFELKFPKTFLAEDI